MSNPLDSVLDWYKTAYDALRITGRVVRQEVDGVVTDRHVFFGESVSRSEEMLDQSDEELKKVAVFTMVAVFERTLREHVLGVVQDKFSSIDDTQNAIRDELKKGVEFRSFSEQLVDAFQLVAEQDRWDVKQLIQFRNWVAHGHFLAKSPAKPPPERTEPRQAHERLTKFLRDGGILPVECQGGNVA